MAESEAIQAEMIKRLVIAHKKICNGNCDISINVLRPIYQQLKGSELTKEESTIFL